MYLKVYCILAHKNPEQLKDLLLLLQDEKSLFFIHLDQRVDLRQYQALIQNANCHFVKNRIACSWGKYSLVQATLNTLQEVHDFMSTTFSRANYHFVMLSGEDLPVKSNQYIHNFLENNIETSFLHHWQLPYENWWGGGWFRMENLYFFDYKKHQKYNYWVNKWIRKIQLSCLLPINQFKKRFPSFNIYGSSQWMILNQDLVPFILQVSNENPKFNAIFKHTHAPDELYFATLIVNFDLEKKYILRNSAMHFVCFEGAAASPKYLEEDDLMNCNSKEILFARKFDSAVNSQSIAFVKKMIS